MSSSAIIGLLLMIAPRSTRRYSQSSSASNLSVCIRKESSPAPWDIFSELSRLRLP